MTKNRRIGFFAWSALSASLVAASCNDRSNTSQTARTDATASSTQPEDPTVAQQQVLVTSAAGPTIKVDSSSPEPRIEFVNNTYVLRLPVAAAKVLFDTLPGFEPLELMSYPNTTTPPFTYLHANVELPSVVLGDFNGDSKPDVALEGRSKQTSATVMLLSTSPSDPTPQFLLVTTSDVAAANSSGFLGLLHPQEIKDPYSQNVAATLHSDGVQRVVPYQSSTVYYLEKGILKQYVYPGD